jgi:hypothetical protein
MKTRAGSLWGWLVLAAFLTNTSLATTFYVNVSNAAPAWPFDSWANAATNIQNAIDASTNGDLVLVTNGVYSSGGRVVYGSLTNRVAILKAITMQSVNGPAATIIQGYQDPSGPPAYSNNVRCVYMTNNAVLAGFTLAHGATLSAGSDVRQLSGGGAFCESTNVTLTNCVLAGNVCASTFSGAGGGAVYQGALFNCILSNNWATTYGVPGGAACRSVLNRCLVISNSATFGGGAAYSTLNDCIVTGNALVGGSITWGGGTYTCIANHCLIAGNFATAAVVSYGGGDCNGELNYCVLSNNWSNGSVAARGGGSYQNQTNGSYVGWLNDCLVISNYVHGDGGGVYAVSSSVVLTNCTVVGNSTTGKGGGVLGGVLVNSIIYGNYCPAGVYGFSSNVYTATLINCWTNDPLFVNPDANDFHLQPGSPCINAGNNVYVTTSTDLDGNVRVIGGTVDIGAYEFKGNIRYVSLSCTNPVAPYSDWSVAATNIQDAIDAAADGDLVLVTNGIYATGGRMWYDSGTNRVTLTNSITLQSVNGPAVTLIVGSHVIGNGMELTNAVRCVGMGKNAVLSGFTLTNGEAGWGNYPNGGGVANLDSGASTVTNCVLIGNLSPTPDYAGGGAYRVKLINCRIVGNQAGYGGGAASCALINCSVVSNSAASGGGVYGENYLGASDLTNCTVVGNSASGSGGGFGGTAITANNCIVYYNHAGFSGDNYSAGTFNYCCTTPMPASGVSNFINDPFFVNLTNGDFHLQTNSPCVNAGNNAYVTTGTDVDGRLRLVEGVVDIGAYETQGKTRYVSLSSANPVAPYSGWSVAATNIQDAVDAAAEGDLVLVTNGIYQDGYRILEPQWFPSYPGTNRVAVTKPLTIQSVNGPSATIINGNGIYRCVLLTNGALLNGFTLINGRAGSTNGQLIAAEGGGVSGANMPFGQTRGGVVANCLLISNSATLYGGGAYGVTLINSTLFGNYAQSGGGAASSRLINCVVSNNSTPTSVPDRLQGYPGSGEGGGIYESDAINCVLANNRAFDGGGASSAVRLVNCTIVSNIAAFDGGICSHDLGYPGPYPACLATNCIIYYNSALSNANSYNYGNSIIIQSCTMPMPTSGQGNITNAPGFVDLANGDYHLAPDSPLINSGINSAITNTTDLDGNPRIAGGTVDIGAYEYQSPTTVLSYAWARQYGFPTDGSADYVDSDGDGMNNWQEFLAGSNPTNAASALAMTSAYPYNNNYLNWHWAIVKWQSVSTRSYYLLRSSDLGSGFICIQSNIVGNAGTTIFQDPTATNGGPYFYRVGVQ